MKICFRVDGNERVASGHIMRCLCIANELKLLGIRCVFIVANQESTYLIKEMEYEYEYLQCDYSKVEEEVNAIINYIKRNDISCLIVDSYSVTPDYLKKLNSFVKVVYFNDTFEVPLEVGMIISYGNISTRINYDEVYCNSKNKPCILLGRKYVPLRREFSNVIYNVRDSVSNVLITVGGSDYEGVLLDLLKKVKIEHKKEYHVVVGAYNKYLEDIEKYAAGRTGIYVYNNIRNMDKLMQQCDVAISAGGTTLYELCAVGTPTICFSISDNQRKLINEMGENGIMLNAGDILKNREKTIDTIIKMLEINMSDQNLRIELSNRMKEFVDGNGANCIAKRIMEYIGG